MEANEAMEVLDGTGRAEADHGRNKEFSAEVSLVGRSDLGLQAVFSSLVYDS